jgi:hypothetical protein
VAVRGYEIVGTIYGVEVISGGRRIGELPRLIEVHGQGRWRKLEGYAVVRLPNGGLVDAEVHWYEAHGIGMRDLKIKRLLD